MTTDVLTALGWLAFILNVWGNLALTTKGVSGWIIRIACNLCWLPYGFLTHAWALVANHALFIAINAYGWWRWAKDARTDGAKQSDQAEYIEYLEGMLASKFSTHMTVSSAVSTDPTVRSKKMERPS